MSFPRLSRRLLAASVFAISLPLGAAPDLPGATAAKLPRWRGFNLLEMFNVGNRKPFEESDFKLISRLGFNFVRLPLDYRCWIKNGNWEEFDENGLREVDRAVELGKKHGVHVCLNLHRAPGYTVATPPEKLSLWTDAEARRVCVLHWAALARRYQGVPSSQLSFNLLNEPAGVKAEVYGEVVKLLADAIHAEDPGRLVIADGLEWGRLPLPNAGKLGVALATRGYEPMDVSHYRAEWVRNAETAAPRWPRPLPPNGTLLSPHKPEGANPLRISGPFVKETNLRLHVQTVSTSARLVVEGDGKLLWEKKFQCGPGEGEWKQAVYVEKWKIYQNLYDRDYNASIPAGTNQVVVRVADGDWLQLVELGLTPSGGAEAKLALAQSYGAQASPVFTFTPDSPGGPFGGLPMQDRAWLWERSTAPWLAVAESGTGVIVGEWGAYKNTPHETVLRWAEDNLANWRKAGMGWALWNFRGTFGILDSGRGDVSYEAWEGHKLDRKLLELLQRY